MTLCWEDVKSFSASIGHNKLVSKLNMRVHFEYYQKSVPCIGNYHCGLVTLAGARNPAYPAKNASQWAGRSSTPNVEGLPDFTFQIWWYRMLTPAPEMT